ncbi:unnamed protein product [Meloidogyne enterolobii]|uniref:Uncharacterized protein n=1 Tax=Meloidogyne enterolobii TaxID=390850 RepID=A0ACB1AR55_MELEN
MKNGNITFISTKLFGGVMIIIFGAYFFYCLRKRAKAISTNMQSNIARNQLNKVEVCKNKNYRKIINSLQPDTLVKLMLCTEIGLNFAPQLTIFIIQLVSRYYFVLWF